MKKQVFGLLSSGLLAFLLLLPYQAHAVVQWSSVDDAATQAESFNGLVWNGTNQLVAVAASGAIFISPNAKPGSWVQQTSGVTTSLNSIIWANGVYVAVGSAGVILSSPDGVTWTSRVSGTVAKLNGVYWSGTKFIAVGNAGTMITSLDGITWTTVVTGIVGNLFDISWNGAVYVAVGSPDLVAISTDGVTWTQTVMVFLPSVTFYSVDRHFGKFFTVGTSYRASSLDGITWNRSVYLLNAVIKDTAENTTGTLVVAVAGTGYNTETLDGTVWTASKGTSNCKSVVWAGDQFVCVVYRGLPLYFAW